MSAGLPFRYHHQSSSSFNQTIAQISRKMPTQRFCLRWNNHQSNLLTVFDQLLHDESFVDVTLAVEGQLLRAHKMVLSACSPYFQALFVNHPDKHPIVILKDVPYSDMRSLLDFMYRGEVSVDQDRLTQFLKVAESLRIKGLTEVNEEKCDNIASTLSQQQQQQQQQLNANANSIPNLQRIYQNKRMATGNILINQLQLHHPKRKRGRPRRLSGNSNGDESEVQKDQQQQQSTSNAVLQGSPEMLEVKMGMDGFTGNNSDGSTTGKEDDSVGDQHHNGGGGRIKDEINNDESMIAGTSQKNLNHTSSNSDDIKPDIQHMTHQQLLTPKVEVNENFDSNSDHPLLSNNNSTTTTTPTDHLISNNNNNMSTPSTSTSSNSNANNTTMSAPTTKPPVKRRIRRRATSHNQDPAEQLTEMSVRGLNLFRYASINEGVYQCTECAKVDVTKTFKNKYSFQRHAFLYHEGQQRKVFPCPVCQKEFSRPDKMKNHMKTVHDYFVPKDAVNDVVFPSLGYFPTM